eukprot:173463-Pelagomonas_calceolata.AAC.6
MDALLTALAGCDECAALVVGFVDVMDALLLWGGLRVCDGYAALVMGCAGCDGCAALVGNVQGDMDALLMWGVIWMRCSCGGIFKVMVVLLIKQTVVGRFAVCNGCAAHKAYRVLRYCCSCGACRGDGYTALVRHRQQQRKQRVPPQPVRASKPALNEHIKKSMNEKA